MRYYMKWNNAVFSAKFERGEVTMAFSFFGGVHPNENKWYACDKETVVFPEPDIVVIPMSQHIGAPCKPLVIVLFANIFYFYVQYNTSANSYCYSVVRFFNHKYFLYLGNTNGTFMISSMHITI